MQSNYEKERILVIAHGHPDHHKGGAEIAAYNLFREYERLGIETIFLARSAELAHGGTVFSSRHDKNELLIHVGVHEWFIVKSIETSHMTREFSSFLKEFAPTIVHVHHYMHIGLDMLQVIRNTLPETKILLTLHEYAAICFNHGQMVKQGSDKLCYKANYMDCAQCFPDRSSADFFLRKQYYQRMFKVVDKFISPSYFLLNRYVEWGIPADDIVMIENGQLDVIEKLAKPRSLLPNELRGKFAYFGQMNHFKGIDVLLEAFYLLPEETKKVVHLDIHGANLESQPKDFQDKIHNLLDDLGDVVTLHGRYESHEMPELLHQCDWTIIPSIWWENSPMVIQEAFNYGRPIIGTDIGGMAEKIEDGVTGFHFRRKNPQSLAQVIKRAVESVDWDEMHKNITKPINIKECAEQHLALIR